MNNQSDPLFSPFQQTLALIEEQYAQGQALVQKHQYAEALAIFEGCLTLASQEQIPLLVDFFTNIMISIGFCHADMGEYEKALKVYHQLETILEQGDGWYRALPEGIEIGIPKDYNPGLPLAAVYESIAIAFDNTNQLEKATYYYKSALTTYFALKDKARAAKTWYFLGIGCRRRGDWRNLQLAGEQIVSLLGPEGDAELKIKGLQFLAQAHVNQNDFAQAATYLKLAITLEAEIGHPDLAMDQEILSDILVHLQPAEPKPKKKWQFWK